MNSVETRILRIIGEDPSSPDVFADTAAGMAQIRESINDAIEEISMLTGSHARKYLLPLNAGQNFYRLSPNEDIAWIKGVWLSGSKRRLVQTDLYALDKYNPRWQYNNGPPERYCIVSYDTICVHPSPVSASDILEIYCCAIPDRYSYDDDRLTVRKEYYTSLINYAVSEYFASRGDAKTAKIWFDKYLETIGEQVQEHLDSFTPKYQRTQPT